MHVADALWLVFQSLKGFGSSISFIEGNCTGSLCFALFCFAPFYLNMGEKKDVKFFNSTALYSRFHPDRYFVTTSTKEILLYIFRKVCKTQRISLQYGCGFHT